MRISTPEDQNGRRILRENELQQTQKIITKKQEGYDLLITDADLGDDLDRWSVQVVLCDSSPVYAKLTRQGDDLLVEYPHENDTLMGQKIVVFQFNDSVSRIKKSDAFDYRLTKLHLKNASAAAFQSLGAEMNNYDPEKYRYGKCKNYTDASAAGGDILSTGVIDDTYYLLSLEDTSGFYKHLGNVETWTADLPSLKTTGTGTTSGMFMDNTKIKTFAARFPHVENTTNMFKGATKLATVNVEWPETLTNASYMFNGCTSLTSINQELPSSLVKTDYMFYNCSKITEWTCQLPSNIETASYMFYGCSGIKEWTTPLPEKLTNMNYMFYNCKLTSWNVGLPDGVKNADYAFNGNNFTVWNTKLPDCLTSASGMFYSNRQLKSFDVELPDSLKNVSYMFANCSALTEFNADIPDGCNCASMFRGSSLKNFNCVFKGSIMESTGGAASSYAMFYGVPLTDLFCKFPKCSQLTEMFPYSSIRNIHQQYPFRKETKTLSGIFGYCGNMVEWDKSFDYEDDDTKEVCPSNITSMESAFYAAGLNEFSADLPQNLKWAKATFYGCSSLSRFKKRLPESLQSTIFMFGYGSKPSVPRVYDFNPDATEESEKGLQNLVNLKRCSGMFYNNNLTEWKWQLPPNMKYGGYDSFHAPTSGSYTHIIYGMFEGNNFTNWTVDIPTTAVDLVGFLANNPKLGGEGSTFNGIDFSNHDKLLTTAAMFYNDDIRQWSSDKQLPPNVQNLSGMFANNKHLTEWRVKIPQSVKYISNYIKIVPQREPDDESRYYFEIECSNAIGMFQGCSTLKTFAPENQPVLQNLDKSYCGMAFYACALDAVSVKNVEAMLPAFSAETDAITFNIGMDENEWSTELESYLQNAANTKNIIFLINYHLEEAKRHTIRPNI